MISAWNLLWIIPLSASFGGVILILLAHAWSRRRQNGTCRNCRCGKPSIYGVWCSGKIMPDDWWCKDWEARR